MQTQPAFTPGLWHRHPSGLPEWMAERDPRWYRVTLLETGAFLTGRWGQLHARCLHPLDPDRCRLWADFFEGKIAALPVETAREVFAGSIFSKDPRIATWHEKCRSAFFFLTLKTKAAA